MKLETTNEIQNWKQNIAQQQKLETNCNIEMKMNLQIEIENEIAIGNEMQKRIGNQR